MSKTGRDKKDKGKTAGRQIVCAVVDVVTNKTYSEFLKGNTERNKKKK